ncbi:hypothetical protein K1T71_014869 [Dendrolimus kikuchii]|nr:hypothetical protein K1T71_014869 [Dendrolimus kikuchii]
MASNLQLVNEYMTYKTFRSDGSVTERELALEVVNRFLESGEVPAEAGSLGETLVMKTNNGAPGYPNLEVKLNTEVVHVQWPQDPRERVKVTTKDGTVYTADNVIITLSVGVLKECYHSLFTPMLPDAKIKAIEHISIGVMDKIILCFDQVWWKGVSCPKGSRNTVTFWTSGEIAKIVETLPEQVVSTKLALLRKFLGLYIKNIPEPTRMIRSTWHTNPYTRGSYTYDNVQTPQHPTARSDLGSPLLDAAGNPRVLFAGEATEANNYATVHGAADSGYREAKRLLDCGNKKIVVQSNY